MLHQGQQLLFVPQTVQLCLIQREGALPVGQIDEPQPAQRGLAVDVQVLTTEHSDRECPIEVVLHEWRRHRRLSRLGYPRCRGVRDCDVLEEVRSCGADDTIEDVVDPALLLLVAHAQAVTTRVPLTQMSRSVLSSAIARSTTVSAPRRIRRSDLPSCGCTSSCSTM